MSNQRAVNFALIGFAALLIYLVSQLTDQLWVYQEWPDQTIIRGVNYPVAIGLVVGSLITVYLRRNQRVNTFLLEAVTEIRQITWPTRQEVIDSTKVVIFASVFLALVLGGFDLVWAKIAKAILQ